MHKSLDVFDEAENCKELYRGICSELLTSGSILIGWTDEEMSHYDILFNIKVATIPNNSATFQGGIRSGNLFVSVMGKGAFSFSINNTKLDETHVAEKLNIMSNDRLAELLTEIKRELMNRTCRRDYTIKKNAFRESALEQDALNGMYRAAFDWGASKEARACEKRISTNKAVREKMVVQIGERIIDDLVKTRARLGITNDIEEMALSLKFIDKINVIALDNIREGK